MAAPDVLFSHSLSFSHDDGGKLLFSVYIEEGLFFVLFCILFVN